MFQFKQFSVDQTNCAMKINTDGVLLGAMAEAAHPTQILDIGTGTGVIALMLAQKFNQAKIDAVEIDTAAATTAAANFQSSVFCNSVELYPLSIEAFFDRHPDTQYDLIISNPPFFLDSLESPVDKKTLAKHTDASFFESLMKDIAEHLSPSGVCWLVLPLQTATLINELALQNGMSLQKAISIKSFEHSAPHRQVVCFGFNEAQPIITEFIIYQAPGIYSADYKLLLKPYFIAF